MKSISELEDREMAPAIRVARLCAAMLEAKSLWRLGVRSPTAGYSNGLLGCRGW